MITKAIERIRTFVPMRIIALSMAVYLFLGSWFPQTDFSQWQKLGQLLEHYEQHQEEALLLGASVSFSTFLSQHFWQPDGHDHSDQDQHDDLPLKGISVSLSFIWEPLPLFEEPNLEWNAPLVPVVQSLCGISRSDSVFRPPIV
jgi:hypothetical protein